ncbi:serine protease [Stieleria mannarensis]|uniref:serine protease n=1 Tax=Stieleria mannarensis TaxID=2755585 RepID=UPI00336A6871
MAVFCVGASQNAQAQLKLDRLFPPTVAAGGESEISAEGKFPKWPASVDCDRADVEITAAKDSGKFTVKIPETSPPGVAWVRFYDDQSASQLYPLVIATVPVTTETEPNDNRDAANAVSMPAVVVGRLAKGGDSDAYRVSLKAGQQLVASVTANQLLASPMDAVLQLTDLRGNVLAQVDDVRGLDPQLVYRSETDQDALVRIFAFPETPNSTIGFSGSSSYVYLCELTTGPFLDHLVISGASTLPFGYNLPEPCTVDVLPATRIAPASGSIPGGLGWAWDSRPAETEIQLHHDDFDGTLPAVLTGHIAEPKQSHTVSFPGVKGTKYRAEVRSKADGYLLDAKLTVTEQKSGSVLASNDDLSRGNVDSGADFTAKEDGIIDVTVSDMIDGYGPRHFYQLTIRESRPECRLTLAEDHFVLPRDKPLEIPVTVERSSGFSDKLQITASGLPPGVVVENVISQPKGDTSKSVKLKLTVGEGAAGNARIQIIGTSLDSDGKPTDRTVTATFPLRPSTAPSEVWLTIPPAPTDGKSSD